MCNVKCGHNLCRISVYLMMFQLRNTFEKYSLCSRLCDCCHIQPGILGVKENLSFSFLKKKVILTTALSQE